MYARSPARRTAGKRRDVLLLIERHEIRRLRDAEHAHRLVREFGGALQRREDHRRGAVADQRAIVDVERVGDRLALHRLLQRDRLAHVRIGIERAVGVILDRDRGQMLLLRPEIVHVPPRDHREQRREGVAGAHLARAIARLRQRATPPPPSCRPSARSLAIGFAPRRYRIL